MGKKKQASQWTQEEVIEDVPDLYLHEIFFKNHMKGIIMLLLLLHNEEDIQRRRTKR